MWISISASPRRIPAGCRLQPVGDRVRRGERQFPPSTSRSSASASRSFEMLHGDVMDGDAFARRDEVDALMHRLIARDDRDELHRDFRARQQRARRRDDGLCAPRRPAPARAGGVSLRVASTKCFGPTRGAARFPRRARLEHRRMRSRTRSASPSGARSTSALIVRSTNLSANSRRSGRRRWRRRRLPSGSRARSSRSRR